MKLITIALVTLFGFAALAADEVPAWKTSFKEGGGGLSFTSPDENVKISLLGYAQVLQKAYLSDIYDTATTADYPLAFSVRRARFDFFATIMKDHTLFVEYDGAPSTSVTAGKEAGFGLIEAHTTHKLMGDAFMLRMGKFVIPFSAENARSSRSIDTVERHMLVNSLFGLPTIDSQYGAMIYGKVLDKGALGWFLSAANGAGKASANYPEKNTSKEITARLNYDIYNDQTAHEQLTFGVAFDHDQEPTQTLTLSDLAGAAYNSVSVSNVRTGYEGDIYFMSGPFSARAEYIDMNWKDAATTPRLDGGMLQLAYFFTGNDQGGFQTLLRAETARLTGALSTADSDRLTAITLGSQWFINANVRHQLNVISTQPNGAAPGVYANNKSGWALLSEMQIKF
jgi:phosphate-selective porin